eukprot:scaffold47661_cov19-Prasinocladus_malaysianus.AAC.1
MKCCGKEIDCITVMHTIVRNCMLQNIRCFVCSEVPCIARLIMLHDLLVCAKPATTKPCGVHECKQLIGSVKNPSCGTASQEFAMPGSLDRLHALKKPLYLIKTFGQEMPNDDESFVPTFCLNRVTSDGAIVSQEKLPIDCAGACNPLLPIIVAAFVHRKPGLSGSDKSVVKFKRMGEAVGLDIALTVIITAPRCTVTNTAVTIY